MARYDRISFPIRSSEEDVKIVAVVVCGWVVGIDIDGILLYCSSHSVNISDIRSCEDDIMIDI